MKMIVKAALVAAALAGGSLAAGLPAMADNVAVTVAPGGVAFGYSDGYWDQGHHWHVWQNKDQAARFRAENTAHYYSYKHDRDHDKGWHDNDHWWGHG
jgi:hypothetical protein